MQNCLILTLLCLCLAVSHKIGDLPKWRNCRFTEAEIRFHESHAHNSEESRAFLDKAKSCPPSEPERLHQHDDQWENPTGTTQTQPTISVQTPQQQSGQYQNQFTAQQPEIQHQHKYQRPFPYEQYPPSQTNQQQPPPHAHVYPSYDFHQRPSHAHTYPQQLQQQPYHYHGSPPVSTSKPVHWSFWILLPFLALPFLLPLWKRGYFERPLQFAKQTANWSNQQFMNIASWIRTKGEQAWAKFNSFLPRVGQFMQSSWSKLNSFIPRVGQLMHSTWQKIVNRITSALPNASGLLARSTPQSNLAQAQQASTSSEMPSSSSSESASSSAIIGPMEQEKDQPAKSHDQKVLESVKRERDILINSLKSMDDERAEMRQALAIARTMLSSAENELQRVHAEHRKDQTHAKLLVAILRSLHQKDHNEARGSQSSQALDEIKKQNLVLQQEVQRTQSYVNVLERSLGNARAIERDMTNAMNEVSADIDSILRTLSTDRNETSSMRPQLLAIKHLADIYSRPPSAQVQKLARDPSLPLSTNAVPGNIATTRSFSHSRSRADVVENSM